MTQSYDVIILGAGAAGLMCAGQAGQRGIRGRRGKDAKAHRRYHAPDVGMVRTELAADVRCGIALRERRAAHVGSGAAPGGRRDS